MISAPTMQASQVAQFPQAVAFAQPQMMFPLGAGTANPWQLASASRDALPMTHGADFSYGNAALPQQNPPTMLLVPATCIPPWNSSVNGFAKPGEGFALPISQQGMTAEGYDSLASQSGLGHAESLPQPVLYFAACPA